MTRDAGPPPVSRIPRRELTATLAAIAVLTVVATVVGVRDWALPDRMFGGRQVTDVPPTLTALLAVSTLVRLVTATALTLRSGCLRLGEPVGVTWLLIVVVAAGALVFNALVLPPTRVRIRPRHPGLPLAVHTCAGRAGRRGRRAPWRGGDGGRAEHGRRHHAAVRARLGPPGLSRPFPGDVLGTLWTTGILGAAPLALGVTIARKRGQTREGRAAAH